MTTDFIKMIIDIDYAKVSRDKTFSFYVVTFMDNIIIVTKVLDIFKMLQCMLMIFQK